MTDLAKLREKRESLKNQLSQTDARIAKIERDQREAEQRELLKIIRARGITAAQLAALLPPAATTAQAENPPATQA